MRQAHNTLQTAARAKWAACGPVCKLHTRKNPAICGEGRRWLDHQPAPTHCPRCRSRLYPIDADYMAQHGICSACVTWAAH